jgi:tetratricopeptide (TPR) repeat protein
VLLLLSLRLYRRHRENAEAHAALLYVAALVAGLGAGNHQTIIFLLPGLFVVLFSIRGCKVRHFFGATAFFALGLSVYLFLPVRSWTGPLSQWGDPGGSIDSFLRIVRRADYGGMRLHPEQSTFVWTLPLVLQHLLLYVRSLMDQFTLPGLLLGVAGIIVQRKNRFFQALLAAMLVAGPLFIIFSNLPPQERTTLPILEPHLVMPNLIFALFAATGALWLLSWRGGGVLLAGIAGLAAVLHAPLCNYRGHFFAYDYGRNILATVEKGGMLYDPDDPTAFITTYLQVVEKKRPDIRLLAYFRTRWGYELLKKRHSDILPGREISSGQELAQVLLEHNRRRYPIYAELPSKFPGEQAYPHGMLYRLSARDEFLPSEAPFPLYRMRGRYVQSGTNDFFTGQVISYYAAARNNLGLAYARQGNPERAREEYVAALAIDPFLSAARNNLGTLAFMQGDYGTAERWFAEVVRQNPSSASALFNLGLAYKAQRRMDDAVSAFRRAWDAGASPEAGNELGLAALGSGDYAGAVYLFQDTVRRFPSYAAAYYNLGLTYQKMGNYDESKRYYTRYLSFSPDPREREEINRTIRAMR